MVEECVGKFRAFTLIASDQRLDERQCILHCSLFLFVVQFTPNIPNRAEYDAKGNNKENEKFKICGEVIDRHHNQ